MALMNITGRDGAYVSTMQVTTVHCSACGVVETRV
jgi:hypothetical protein